MSDVEKLREAALAELKQRRYAQGVIQVPSADDFNAGFDAGHSARSEWHKIEGPEDLPKVAGEYIFKLRRPERGGYKHQHHYFTTLRLVDYVERYSAWMPIPPDQTEQENQNES